jgi:hypothetical protein
MVGEQTIDDGVGGTPGDDHLRPTVVVDDDARSAGAE